MLAEPDSVLPNVLFLVLIVISGCEKDVTTCSEAAEAFFVESSISEFDSFVRVFEIHVIPVTSNSINVMRLESILAKAHIICCLGLWVEGPFVVWVLVAFWVVEVIAVDWVIAPNSVIMVFCDGFFALLSCGRSLPPLIHFHHSD